MTVHMVIDLVVKANLLLNITILGDSWPRVELSAEAITKSVDKCFSKATYLYWYQVSPILSYWIPV